MSLDIAMGGSTNTVLHLLAVAQEAGVDFTMKDIDRLSRKIPHICKMSPSTPLWHMEDLHNAGGIMNIMAQLKKKNLLHLESRTVLGMSLGEQIDKYDLEKTTDADVKRFYSACAGGKYNIQAFSQSNTVDKL